ncbi:MAG: hypothetical protein GY808_08780 [Gammaproteobacteria bacterium]|nr:hypothetical protein [Gammaproteobacteria bacterium]
MRNQARAMEVYAKQAMNLNAERQAVEIRIRAERKAGQLMKSMERSHGGDRNSKFHHENLKTELNQAKQDSGISNSQAHRWQKLAEIPDKEFEESVKGKQFQKKHYSVRISNMEQI